MKSLNAVRCCVAPALGTILTCLVPGPGVFSAQLVQGAEAERTYLLRAERADTGVDYVEAQLDVSGNLRMYHKQKMETLKMTAAGAVQYEDRLLSKSAGIRTVRYYQKAEADIQVADARTRPVLRDARRRIAVVEEKGKAALTLFSPEGSLTSEELDLVNQQVDSLLLDRLLPDEPVSIGQRWKAADTLVQAILGMDSVAENSVQSTLNSVTDGIARMDLSGQVRGREHGLETSFELKARYRFDLKRKRVTWIGMALRHDRKPGRVEPGLEVTATLQVLLEPDYAPKHLTAERLKDLPADVSAEQTYISDRAADGTWQLEHDRRWILTTQTSGMATLHLAHEGDSLAQCQVSTLPPTKAGEKFGLEDFQADIRRVLDKNFGQFIEASESVNPAGYRVYRVVAAGEPHDAAGKSLGMPYRWVYYMLAEPQGRRAVLLFDFQEEHLDRVGRADRELAAQFRFLTAAPEARQDQEKVAAKPADAKATRP